MGHGKLHLFIAMSFAMIVSRPAACEDLHDQAFDCLMEPVMTVKLGTPVDGIISEVKIERGDLVKKGQVVALLEAKVEKAMYALARTRASNESSVKSAEAHYGFLLKKAERLQKLLNKSVGSVAALEEAQAEAEVARQQVNEAVLNQEIAKLDEDRAEAVMLLRTIVSPVDGVITERLMAPGEYRSGQSHLATIAQTNPLHIEVFLPNSYFGKIEKGSEAEIEPDQPVGGKYRARVSVIDEVLDAKSGTFGVQLNLPNEDHKLPAGLSCHVKFQNAPR